MSAETITIEKLLPYTDIANRSRISHKITITKNNDCVKITLYGDHGTYGTTINDEQVEEIKHIKAEHIFEYFKIIKSGTFVPIFRKNANDIPRIPINAIFGITIQFCETESQYNDPTFMYIMYNTLVPHGHKKKQISSGIRINFTKI